MAKKSENWYNELFQMVKNYIENNSSDNEKMDKSKLVPIKNVDNKSKLVPLRKADDKDSLKSNKSKKSKGR